MAENYYKRDGDGIDGIVKAYFEIASGTSSPIGEIHFGRDVKATSGIKGTEKTPVNTSWFFSYPAFLEIAKVIIKDLVTKDSAEGKCWVTFRTHNLNESTKCALSLQLIELTIETRIKDYAWAHCQCLRMKQRIDQENRPKMVMTR